MSDAILPDLIPGVQLIRAPYTRVSIQESLSGKESRVSYWWAPRRKFSLEFPILREINSEASAFLGFLARHFYSLDSFLLRDPDDCVVKNHGFGVGDGTTRFFQLQRTLAEGEVYDRTGGPWVFRSTRTTNHVLYSSDSTKWTTAGDFSLIGACVSPEGIFSAGKFGTGATGGELSISFEDLPEGNSVASFWIRSDDLTSISIEIPLIAYGTISISPTWTRVSFAFENDEEPDGVVTLKTTASSKTFEIWGAQVEAGTSPTRLITTEGVPVSGPHYWPSFVDGFEPIYEIAGDVEIFVDGIPAANYSIEPYGVVAFDEGYAPSEGAALSWSGSYFFRVRLDTDGPELERIFESVYSAGTIDFIEVLP